MATLRKTRKKRTTKPYERTSVRLSQHAYRSLLNEQENYDNEHFQPNVFLLGENKYHIVKDIILLNPPDNEEHGGCDHMPEIDRGRVADAYIKLAKQNLIGCGYARVSDHFEFDGTVQEDTGIDIYNKDVQYLLSVDDDNITAQVARVFKRPGRRYTFNRLTTLYVEVLDK